MAKIIKKVGINIINSLSIKRFIQSKLQRTKTDKSDAVMLVEYGQIMEPALWKPDSVHYTQAQQLLNIQAQLVKNRTSINNQMEAIDLSVNQTKTGLSLLKKQLKFVENQLAEIDKELEQLIDNDEDVNNIETIAIVKNKSIYVENFD
jgi:transposase